VNDKEIYERPELNKEDYPHLEAHEFNQFRYYGHVKGSDVPEEPEGRCPECHENSFILRQYRRSNKHFIGDCVKCGFTLTTKSFYFQGRRDGVKYALENPEAAEKWLKNQGEEK
jgi:Zn ribbon nucleic-acid-binding protein